MQELLEFLTNKGMQVPEYIDVKSIFWKPGEPQVEKCPQGCDLEIYEDTPKKWARIPERDAYRQTRICREHGFARIYIITGPTGMAENWNP